MKIPQIYKYFKFLLMLKYIVDFFFPKTCYYCEKEGRYICNECIRNYVQINWEPKCYVCGKACTAGLMHRECKEQGYIDGLIYFTVYDQKIKRIIKDVKYSFYFDILNELGEIMSEYLKTYHFSDDLILTDVPLHKKKKRFRGFNQAEILARVIAKRSGFKYCKLLNRVENTTSQVKLSHEERENNLINAFQFIGKDIPDKIMIVDDVFTSGSTINQCAKVLKSNGSKEVYGYVFAKSRE